MKSTDEKYMSLALELAGNGRGFVSPNPLVGAVIVLGGKVIGSGFHAKFGESHAEINAINNAKENGISSFSDCTIYVTLEPCSHFGKTPPCALALVENNFKRVVIAMSDPHSKVDGTGILLLKNAGIEVELGVLEEEARWLNRFFIKHIQTSAPYIISKFGISLDGRIALENGESQWITSEESRKDVHKTRAEVDAVLVGRSTALSDNPKLNIRHVEGRDPRRIVCDSDLSLPLELNLFSDENARNTFVIHSENDFDKNRARELSSRDVKLISVKKNKTGLDLKSAFKIFGKSHGINSILVEGGALIHSYLMQNNLFDELHSYIAPIIIGRGLGAFSNLKYKHLKDVPHWELKKYCKLANDIKLIYINKL
jgi:diaminohydroxyphosphoribosylaminopyrimidine deaminase / 5-amino-6-(5-phosphoribosylamino)uracil reductase